MHGAFINQKMQLKVSEQVKGILSTIEAEGEVFTEVKTHTESVIKGCITKVTAKPKPESVPKEKKVDLKEAKKAIGKKRVYADADVEVPAG